MRKIISLSLAVVSVMALAVFASCQKDNEVVTRFDATMEGFSVDGKTEYNVNDGLLYWVPGDQIEIFGTNSNYGTYEYSTEVTGNVIPFNHVNGNAGEPTYRAIYPASSADVQGRLVLPSVQHSPDGSLTGYPMYAEADDTFLEFKNLGGVLKLRLKKQGVVVTSQYWNIAYGRTPGEAAQDTEGMQTMRTLANNMAWLLKKIHANDNPDYPEREPWAPMNFIR